jgi:hypothetical protein
VVPEAHLERLAILALLAGLRPAPVEACRVLELGSEGVGQLLPLALALPNSEFVAVGSSVRAASEGRRCAKELGLSNLTLYDADVEELPESLGSFDYVLVHGTSCFTSVAAREAALWALNRRLSPSGIGYVSFNSQPGALVSDAARRLLEAYVAAEPSAAPRGEKIRRIAALLAASLSPMQPLGLALKLEFEELARSSTTEPWLESGQALGLPCYFEDFAQALAPHALAYFAEAVPGADDVTRLPSAARDALAQFVNTSSLWQQSLDLYSGRAVRHALVRRAGASPERPSSLEAMQRLVVGCAAELQVLDGKVRLQSRSKAVAHVSEPGVSRAFVQLCRSWPEFLSFQSLSEQISRDDPGQRSAREQALAEQLYQLFRAGVVELRLEAPRCTARPGERPLASALARRMAGAGEKLFDQHQNLLFLPDADARKLLTLCDGERTREQLLAAWESGSDADLEALLERLARLALIVN